MLLFLVIHYSITEPFKSVKVHHCMCEHIQIESAVAAGNHVFVCFALFIYYICYPALLQPLPASRQLTKQNKNIKIQ